MIPETNMDPIIETYIRNLIDGADHIGTCAGIVRVNDLKTGSNRSNGNIDRFKIIIPYGGQYIKWEVIFYLNETIYPPDFIFLSDNGQFIPEISNLKSLINWKSNDANSLLNVVKELIAEYKRYNLRKLENSQLLAEYAKLLAAVTSIASAETSEEDEADISDAVASPVCLEENVEAFMQGENGQIQLMIKLSLDFSNLPRYVTEDKGSDDKVLSIITYPNANSLKGNSKLCLSPRLEKAFNLIGGLKTLQFNKENDLRSYVYEITEQVQKQVDGLGRSYEYRKSYIASLSQIFPQILEFDSLYFNKLNLFITINDFSFILNVTIPLTFPSQKPCLNLISVYQQKEIRGRGSILVNKSFSDYPYSPRWPAEEMASRAKNFIEIEAIKFQKECNE